MHNELVNQGSTDQIVRRLNDPWNPVGDLISTLWVITSGLSDDA